MIIPLPHHGDFPYLFYPHKCFMKFPPICEPHHDSILQRAKAKLNCILMTSQLSSDQSTLQVQNYICRYEYFALVFWIHIAIQNIILCCIYDAIHILVHNPWCTCTVLVVVMCMQHGTSSVLGTHTIHGYIPTPFSSKKLLSMWKSQCKLNFQY